MVKHVEATRTNVFSSCASQNGTIWPLWFGRGLSDGIPTRSLRKVVSAVKGHEASGYGVRIRPAQIKLARARAAAGSVPISLPLRTSRAEIAVFSSDQYRRESETDLSAGSLQRQISATGDQNKLNLIFKNTRKVPTETRLGGYGC